MSSHLKELFSGTKFEKTRLYWTCANAAKLEKVDVVDWNREKTFLANDIVTIKVDPVSTEKKELLEVNRC